jgi:tRNA pseudouridine55 synthase
VVDKPEGPTSHDVVDRVRRAFGVRRVGHTGTLDPFATGVLPVCIGKATRLASILSAGAKAYEATIRLGFATSTDDRTGTPLGPPQPVAVTREAAEAVCSRFVGELDQVPPAYSAKRVAGERLYELARRGARAEPKPYRVTVFALELRRVGGETLEIGVRCSAGTYIRALARDIGEALASGGHLSALRRTWSGGFGLEHAVTWDELAQAGLASRIMRLEALLPEIPAVRVGEDGLRALRHGRDIERSALIEGSDWSAGERFRVLGEDGALVALATPSGDRLHAHLVLVE